MTFYMSSETVSRWPPKPVDGFANVADACHANRLPPAGEKTSIPLVREPGVNKQHHPPVGFGANDPPRSLEHTVHARKAIGVFKSGPGFFLKIVADQVTFDRDLRQSHADDDRAYQPVSHQIDAYAENPSHDGQADQ